MQTLYVLFSSAYPAGRAATAEELALRGICPVSPLLLREETLPTVRDCVAVVLRNQVEQGLLSAPAGAWQVVAARVAAPPSTNAPPEPLGEPLDDGTASGAVAAELERRGANALWARPVPPAAGALERKQPEPLDAAPEPAAPAAPEPAAPATPDEAQRAIEECARRVLVTLGAVPRMMQSEDSVARAQAMIAQAWTELAEGCANDRHRQLLSLAIGISQHELHCERARQQVLLDSIVAGVDTPTLRALAIEKLGRAGARWDEPLDSIQALDRATQFALRTVSTQQLVSLLEARALREARK